MPQTNEPRRRRLSAVVLAAAATFYLGVSFDHLSAYPPVGEDEPWIAAPAYKLATTGVYGSDLFAGYYGVERRDYQHMPLYPMLQALVFKAAGIGVFQMRLLAVVFGFGLLVTTYLVGSRLRDGRVGALAAVLLVTLRLSYDGYGTGVLLLDRARVNRYDIAAPVFGLLALWLWLRATRMPDRRRAFTTGVLVGLASLSHLFGVFWLPILLAPIVFERRASLSRAQSAAAVICGFAVTCVPWAIYIATGWQDYLGQMRFVAERFDLLSPSFYVSNLLHGGGPLSVDWIEHAVRQLPLQRPGAWSAVIVLPVALCSALWAARHNADHEAARRVAIVLLAQFAMFLMLLKVKTINYMIGIWPLAVLMLAWFLIWLWDRRTRLLRIAAAALVAGIVVEGLTGATQAAAMARRASPYDWYTSEIARCIPAGSRVLGLQHYWLGLRQYDYRSWLMATNLAHPRYYHQPMTLDAALEQIDPDIVLLDQFMTRFFDEAGRADHPYHSLRTGFEAYMARKRAQPVCAVHNRTYGTMSVYRVER